MYHVCGLSVCLCVSRQLSQKAKLTVSPGHLGGLRNVSVGAYLDLQRSLLGAV